MNLTTAPFQQLSASLADFTPFANADITCDLATVEVTQTGDSTLSTTSDGWLRVEGVKTQKQNLQARVTQSTTALFAKTSPGASETLVINSTIVGPFSAILSKITL